MVNKPPFNREDELKLRAARGEEAEKILANPLVIHAFATMERELVTALKTTKQSQINERDDLLADLRALERFRGKFLYYRQTGDVAQKTLMQRIKEKF